MPQALGSHDLNCGMSGESLADPEPIQYSVDTTGAAEHIQHSMGVHAVHAEHALLRLFPLRYKGNRLSRPSRQMDVSRNGQHGNIKEVKLECSMKQI